MNEKQPTISACIMALNEEKNLPRCLDSIKNLVDEIIVGVDDRTTDNTKAIAEKYGAITFDFDMADSFAESRNKTLEKATGDFILVVDADNILDPSSIPVIQKFMLQDTFNVGTFRLIHKMPSGDSMSFGHRIFRSGCVRYEGRKHNQAVTIGATVPLQATIYHTGFGLSDEEQTAKSKRDERLLLMEIDEHPEVLFHYQNLARNLRSQERWQDVLDVGEKGLKAAKDNPAVNEEHFPHCSQMLKADMIYACIELKQHEAGMAMAKAVLEEYPDNVDIWLYCGHLFMCLQDFVGAINAYHRYIKQLRMVIDGWMVSSLTIDTIGQGHQAYNNLAICYQQVNRTDRSVPAMRNALRAVPDSVAYLKNYANMLEIESTRVRLKAGRLKILFVQRSACIRNAKMAKALVANGHQVGLAFQRETLERYGMSNDFYCDIIQIPYKSEMGKVAEALERAADGYDIVHCHNEPDDLSVTAIGAFSAKKPVIHDCHDITTAKLSDCPPEAKWMEHMALLNADGLVFVSPEQAQQAHGLHKFEPGKAIILYNYPTVEIMPDSEAVANTEKLSEKDGELHIVYEGGLKLRGHRDYRELFTLLVDNDHLNVHIHIYPNFASEEYKELAEGNDYLHYHDPLPPDKLLLEMAQYDAGLIPLNVQDPQLRFAKSVSMPNKLFEYLAVGLPVIARDLPALRKFITENECGILFETQEELLKQLPIIKDMKIKDDFATLTMEAQISKLEQFYWHMLGMTEEKPNDKVAKAPVLVTKKGDDENDS